MRELSAITEATLTIVSAVLCGRDMGRYTLGDENAHYHAAVWLLLLLALEVRRIRVSIEKPESPARNTP